MIIGYFDETANAHQDFVAMSGYLADDSNWSALASDWGVLLDQYQIPFLHVADFVQAKGIYQQLGWQEPEKNKTIPDVLDAFIGVICQHTIFGIGIGIDASKFREILAAVKKKPKPEVFCFERILGGAVAILDKLQWPEPICLIFDDSEHYAMKAYANYCEVRRRRPEVKQRVAMIGFGNDELVPPLQAADLLAYATQNLQDRGGQDAWLNHPQFSKLLSSSRPGYGKTYLSEFWDASFLEEQRDNLVAIANGKPFIV